MTSSQSILIIARTSPYGNHLARAAIDLALTAAAFEQVVHMVFMDDAVAQLFTGQDTTSDAMKNMGKIVSALELYDVRQVYLHSESAMRFGLTPENSVIKTLPVDDAGLRILMANASQVMVF